MIDAWSRRVAALTQVRVADITAPELLREDDHHLRRVLRARDGEEIVLSDGRGSWRMAAVTSTGLEVLSDVAVDPALAETTLYLAPLKGERGEWAIAKATEVGLARVVPLVSARLTQKFRGEARDKVLARWRRIADETCAQCRRTHDLEFSEPVTPGEVPAEVAVADFAGSGDWSGVTAVAIGPEGGWAPGDWDEERRRLSLGPTVLRGETAAAVAAALLAFTNGSWGFTVTSVQNE
jgi:16S rRNA (uracil1498-N3)-methyltransferase